MSEFPAASAAPPALAARLQRLTEALAAAQTRAEVLEASLQPAMTALGACAGTVLLLGASGESLEVALVRGDASTPDGPSGPGPLTLSPELPAADALLRRQTLFLGPDGARHAAPADPDAASGTLSPVAHLCLPLHDGRPLGTLMLDFQEARALTAHERLFLEVLARQTALALRRAELLDELGAAARVFEHDQLLRQEEVRDLRAERVRLSEQVSWGAAALREEQAALRAFVDFSEAASHAGTMEDLTRLALHALREVLPGSTGGFYERRGDRWWPRTLDDRIPDELRNLLEQGLPLDTPVLARLLAEGGPIFVDDWQEDEQHIAHTAAFQTVAMYPVGQGGEIRAALAVGLRAPARWDARSRGVVEALGRSFALLHDRVADAERLRLQRLEARQQAQVLSAFSQLARHLLRGTDRYALIRQAQQIVLSLLPGGCAAYWEPEDGLWRMKAQTGDFGHADLQRAADGGLPLDALSLAGPWASGEAYYQDRYAVGTDTSAAPRSQVLAAASLPLRVGGRTTGIFAVGLFEQRSWSPADRTVLDTAVQSLSLALERAQAALALAERTAELERSNRDLQTSNEELEAFTYSASHDLRAPVRHVQGFAELALRALDKEQPGKAREYLGVVTGAAERMTAMIDAMLVLSRAGRTELRTQTVSLAALAQRAQQDARMEFPDQAVEWDVGELPAVQGDPVSLQQVLTNLLSNAVKYSQGPAPARVRLWAEDRPDEVAVFVQDRGVGYDPQYAANLFGAFQRLHTQAQFAGTGIGLATVRRIVNRHGGHVSAQGRPGEGATFGFTLPKR